MGLKKSQSISVMTQREKRQHRKILQTTSQNYEEKKWLANIINNNNNGVHESSKNPR